jgi:hypothetical protein
MSAIRSRSGFMVRRDGTPGDAALHQRLRCETIDALVRDLGAVEALDRCEAAVRVCEKQAADAAHRGHLGAARGFEAAAAYCRQNVALLVERHA